MNSNQEILAGLKFFAELTQRTLSAFHLSATNDGLEEDIDELKRLFTNKRKLITCVEENGEFRRIFEDGYEDVVPFEGIAEPSFFDISSDLKKIGDVINNNNFNSIAMLKKADISITEFKPIETASERIFFM